MIELLIKNPILILFLIIAVGYLLGRIRIGNFSLGVAGALFAGIGLSALNPALSLPPFIYTFGLVLFVYTTGIALGPTFFAALRKTGLRDNLFTLGILVLGVSGIFVAAKLLGFSTPLAAGMYTGTFTVTPALAGVLETIGANNPVPVVGYSLAYPFSILVSLCLLSLFRKLWNINKHEAAAEDSSLGAHTLRFTRNEKCLVADLPKLSGANFAVSRVRIGQEIFVPSAKTTVSKDDLLTIVATPKDYQKAVAWIGEDEQTKRLEDDNTKLSARRIFLTNAALAGRRLGSLKLADIGVTTTRVRRGDVDILARDNLVVELGDRLRIVGSKDSVKKASSYVGDSYKHASEMNILPFAIGIVLGIALGAISIPLPGGSSFSLGAAGGTIVVAMVLGALRRSGPLVWQIPYSTNLSIRQLGLMIFLAGVGSKAGGEWIKALANPASYQLMAASSVVAAVAVIVMLVIGYKLLKIPFTRLSGMVAAMNTQPATLAYANDQTKTDDANIGYASVYPMALVVKIVLAQLLLIALK